MLYKYKHTFEDHYISHSLLSIAGCGSGVSSVLGLMHFKKKENLFFLCLFGLLRSSIGSAEDVSLSGMSCFRRVSVGRLLRAYAFRSLYSGLSAEGIWTSPLLSWALPVIKTSSKHLKQEVKPTLYTVRALFHLLNSVNNCVIHLMKCCKTDFYRLLIYLQLIWIYIIL